MSLTRSLRSQLASLYLRTGKSDKALEQLDIALSDITEQTDITSMVTTVRHLACYHMREGHADAAYHVLQNVLHKAAQRGFQRPTYLNGMVLELLEALHDRGFPPLPCYDFPQELQRCLNGPNRLLRGVALRLHGKQLAAAGQTAQAIEACRHSITLLDALHDALEAGKSRLLLAQLLLPEDEGKARLLLHEAWAVYPYLKHHFWPESLLPLIPRYPQEGQDQAVSERSPAGGYREHFAPRRPVTSFESFPGHPPDGIRPDPGSGAQLPLPAIPSFGTPAPAGKPGQLRRRAGAFHPLHPGRDRRHRAEGPLPC